MARWRNIKIFISSTFKDMDAERDAIKFTVVPALNRRFRDRCIEFRVIDLRVGVNTADLPEHQRENRVLDVCLQNIDDSRPFFIGLLGARYGWIPAHERFEYIVRRLDESRRPLISGGADCSVTELEILYGAMGSDGTDASHSLFFYRDDDTYDSIPESRRSEYMEVGRPENSGKLSRLKRRVADSLAASGRAPRQYSLRWDSAAGRLSGGLDDFAALVEENLAEIIEADLGADRFEMPWWEAERLNDDYLLHAAAVSPYASAPSVLSTASHLSDLVSRGRRVLLVAEPGMGQTEILAKACERIEADGTVCLTAIIGATAASTSPEAILSRWADRICADAGRDVPYNNPTEAEDVNLQELVKYLATCIENDGRKYCFIISAADNLAFYDNDSQYLSWLPQSVPAIISVGRKNADEIKKLWPEMSIEEASCPDDADFIATLDAWQRRNAHEINVSLRDKIRRFADSPQRLLTALSLLSRLGTDDFAAIRAMEGDEIAKIVRYLESVIDAAPQPLTELSVYSISEAARRVGDGDMLLTASGYIILSGDGLRESDLEALIGSRWDSLSFRSMMESLSTLFYEDRILNKWKMRDEALRKLLVEHVSGADEKMVALSRYFSKLPASDPIGREMLAYYALKAADGDAIRCRLLFSLRRDDKRLNADAEEHFVISMRYLDGDGEVIRRITDEGIGLTPGERVRLIDNVLGRGFKRIQLRRLLLENMEAYLLSFPTDTLDAEELYALAYRISDLTILNPDFDYKDSVTRAARLIRVIEIFDAVLALDACNENARQMRAAMVAQLIPILAAAGRIDEMENYISKL